jgi:hypothetical protein
VWAAVHAAPLGAGEVDAAAGDVFGVLLEGRGASAAAALADGVRSGGGGSGGKGK